MSVKAKLLQLHNWLIPEDEPMPLAPYVWLVNLAIFFLSLYFYRSTPDYLWHVIPGLLTFLALYFHGYHANSRMVLIDIALICVVGTWMTFITPGASVFFVFAAAFACRVNNTKLAFMLLVIISAYVGLISWLFEFHVGFYIPSIMFVWIIGGINIYSHAMYIKQREIQLSKQELKSLAATAERERIARDLHDVIGHTLSLLTRKAELAGRLINRDNDRAELEVKEIETISRDALQQVREVISGYRSSDLVSELAHAKYVLESNDISFNYELQANELNETKSKEIAVIVKELVTNVLKHAEASQVQATISQENDLLRLIFADNGNGCEEDATHSGFGLQGIAERVKAMNGTIRHGLDGAEFSSQMAVGFGVIVEVPLHD